MAMPNRLRTQTSPYLLQHADNPVEWQPWDGEALALARSTGKPILLSVGYSACHWCHVMAHESFEDPETAELMNRLFVNIKIDREERPDLDRIYQMAHQLFTGRGGGWPLTVFLTPDEHLPIFAGTYFPKERRYGMPAFRDVLTGIADHARKNEAEIRKRGHSLVEALRSQNANDDEFGAKIDDSAIRAARVRVEQSFDPRFGGFGGAPKFPQATQLGFLLDFWHESKNDSEPDDQASTMAAFTLSRMAESGLYDHLGGGFFRYCVDEAWIIPHFEKMLYDNAALLGLYADAYAALQVDAYGEVARETAEWVMRDMQAPEGAFYATLDADSEGSEGKYYVWTPTEARQLLDNEELAIVEKYYGLGQPPNFEGEYWHLRRGVALEDVASGTGLDLEAARVRLVSARRKLLAARSARVPPGRDDKHIASWNGLMIAGMAKAARRLDEPEFAASAMRATDFVRERMFFKQRLHATFKDGRASDTGYLDDYAFVALGLLELLQSRWRRADLDFAIELLDSMLEHFQDPTGGFFFTADDHEKLIYRPKPFADESLPAGNAIAAQVLQSFGHLLGAERYISAAAATVRAALPRLEQYPEAHTSMLRAVTGELSPPELLIARGDPDSLRVWQTTLDRDFAGRRMSFFIPDDESRLPGMLAERAPGCAPVAYYCEGTVCRAPVSSLDELNELLG